MSVENTRRRFRPLVWGICVKSSLLDQVGTLGCIAADRLNGTPWLVTCLHVLAKPPPGGVVAFGQADQLGQPHVAVPIPTVGNLNLARFDANLDCAAVPLLANIPFDHRVLCLGPPQMTIANPVNVTDVVKCGAATAVTEGRVVGFNNGVIQIEPRPGYPPEYSLSEHGDSGAIWFEQDTMKPLGMHFAGNHNGGESAAARPLQVILDALGLTLPANPVP